MPIQIYSGLSDDNDFVALIDLIVNGLLTRKPPDQVWVIHIDNWFDHKWLRYSGNGSKANWMFAGVPVSDFISNRLDSVKAEFSQTKVTFPPFSPGRVIGQWSFLRTGDNYVEFPLPAIPHDTRKMRSETNLHRHIEDFSKSACFVWYSGNTLANGRGSLMVYGNQGCEVSCWFAAFQRDRAWTLKLTKGIAREEILRLTGGN